MLILQRKLGQQVSIGRGQIVMTVLEIQKGRVKLGFLAPPSVPIMRVEIENWDGMNVVAAIAGESDEERTEIELDVNEDCEICESKDAIREGQCQRCGHRPNG